MLAQAYLIYLAISIAITVWVGYSLSKNGRVFLIAVFKNNVALADSINHLLLVGFYLINYGFISLALKGNTTPGNWEESMEFLSAKIGLVIVVLGGMHFFNMYVLMNFRNFKLFQPHDEAAAKQAAVKL